MKFGLFTSKVNDNLEIVRTSYINENKIKKEIKMLPCSKYVACQDKLSRGYVLALTDQKEIETMKVASLDDVEFFEGYEIASRYTDELRKIILKDLVRIYEDFLIVINNITNVINLADIDKKQQLDDNKINMISNLNIINNIYQSIAMNDDNIDLIANNDAGNKNKTDIIDKVRDLLNKLISIDGKIIIEYINKQLRMLYLQLMNFINLLLEIKK